MAGLHFNITAENKNLLHKLEEIKRGVREAAKQMEQSGNQAKDAINQAGSKIRFGESLKKQVRDAESSLDNLTQKITNQRVAVREVESDVKRLTKAYSGLSRYSTKRDSALSELNAAKRALEEEKNTLFGLQTEHRNTRLSVKRLKDELTRYRDEQTQVVGSNTNMAASFRKTLAAIGGTAMLKKFVGDVIRVRGEFQQLNVSFTTLLQSKEKADILMAQMIKTAATTPFSLMEVATGARQLIAYGFQAEEVNETLIRLGNIASGLGLPLERLSYLYGTTMTQGRLYARDLMQFTTSGIPMLQGLADMFGVTTEEVNKMVSAGKIGFPEVKKVIENMTNEGGKFYNLMQEQSKTITGKISNLGDAWQTTLNKIGESQDGVINASLDSARLLVENYETVGRTLAGLIATYGTYRAAVMLVTAVESKHTLVEIGLTNVRVLARKAQQALNATMLTNPYVLLATAVAGLVAAVWALHGSTTAAEAAQKQLNEEHKKAAQEKQELTSKTESLIAKINSETESVYAQIKAYKELVELFPELKGMTFEEFKAMPQSQQKSMVDNMTDKKELEDAIRLYEDDLKEIERINKKLHELSDIGVNEATSLLYEKLGNQLEIAQKLAEGHKAQIEEIKQTQWEANTPVEEKVKHYEKIKESLEAERRALYQQVEPYMVLKSSVEGMNEAWGQMPNYIDKIKLDVLNKQLEETTGKINSLTGKGDSSMLIVTKNKAHWEEQKKNATTALEAIDSRVQAMLKAGNKTGAKSFLVGDLKKTEKEADAVVKSYSDSISKLNEANKNLKLYDFSDKTKNDLLKSQTELSRSILDSDLKLQEMRLVVMEDGRQKRLKQSELEYKQQKAAIDKEYQDTVQKYREQYKPVPNSVKTTYEARLGANNAAKGARDNKINEAYLKERKEREAALTAYLLTEESKRKKAIKERYDAEREWAKKQFQGENMTDTEYTNYLGRINTAEVVEGLQELLDKYQDYTAQRKDIEKNFDEEIATLERSWTDRNAAEVDRAIAEAQKKRKEALSGIDLSEFQDSIDWSSVFGDLDAQTTQALSSLREKLKNYINKAAKDLKPEDLKVLQDAFKDIDLKISERRPFRELGKDLEEYKAAQAGVNKAQEELNYVMAGGEIVTGLYMDKTGKMVKKLLTQEEAENNLTEAQKKRKAAIAAIGNSAAGIAEQIGNVSNAASKIVNVLEDDFGVKVGDNIKGLVEGFNELSDGVSSVVQAAMKGDIAGVIAGVVQSVGGLFKSVTSIFGLGNHKGEEDLKRLEEASNRIVESQKIINSLIEKRIELINKATIAEQKNLAATTEQAIKNQKAYYEQQFKNLQSNWLLDKKGKHNNLTAAQLGVYTIKDLEEFLSSDKLISLQKQGYNVRDLDKWKEIIDAYNELEDKETALSETVSKNLTGITLEDAQSALDEFLKNADTSMEDVAGSFENYMRDAMLGIVKQNILNKSLEKWYENFEDAVKNDGRLSETEVKDLQQEYENAFTTAQEAYTNMLKVANISPESDSSGRQASEKGIASMSQDSANELNGNFSALLIYSNKTAENTSSLRESMNYILEIQRAGWGDVRAIKELTSQMRVHTEKISELSEMIESNTKKAATGIDTLNTKGIYLKK